MQSWAAMAAEQDDRGAQDEAARELVWILEGWGRVDEARRAETRRAAEFDEQMPLLLRAVARPWPNRSARSGPRSAPVH